MFLVDPALPRIAAEFGVDATRAVLVASVFMLSCAIGQLVVSPFADRRSKGRIIVTLVISSGLANCLSALAGDFALLLASRAVAGLCVGPISPLLFAVMADNCAPEDIQVRFARLSAASVLGSLTGMLLSGFLAETLHWTYALVLVGALAVVVGTLCMSTLMRSGSPAPGGRATGGASAFPFLRILTDRASVLILASQAVIAVAVLGLFANVGFILDTRISAGPDFTALVVAGFMVGSVAYGYSLTRALARFPVRRWMTFCAIAGATGFVLLDLGRSVPMSFAAMFCIAIGYRAVQNPLQATLARRHIRDRTGAMTLLSVTALASQGLGAILYARLPDTQAMLWICSATVLAVALLARNLVSPGPGSPGRN